MHAIESFFAGAFSVSRSLQVDVGSLQHLSDAELVDAARQMRDAMAAVAKSVSRNYRAAEYYEYRFAKAFAAEQVLRAGFNFIDRDAYELAEGTLGDAVATQAWAREQRQLWSAPLADFDRHANRRLSCAFALARREAATPTRDVGNDPTLPRGDDGIDVTIAAFNAASAAMRVVWDAWPTMTALDALRSLEPGSSRPELTAQRLVELTEQERLHRRQLEDVLRDVRCPATIAETPGTLDVHCGLRSTETTMGEVVNLVKRRHFTLLCRVTSIALRAEAYAHPGSLMRSDPNGLGFGIWDLGFA